MRRVATCAMGGPNRRCPIELASIILQTLCLRLRPFMAQVTLAQPGGRSNGVATSGFVFSRDSLSCLRHQIGTNCVNQSADSPHAATCMQATVHGEDTKTGSSTSPQFDETQHKYVRPAGPAMAAAAGAACCPRSYTESNGRSPAGAVPRACSSFNPRNRIPRAAGPLPVALLCSGARSSCPIHDSAVQFWPRAWLFGQQCSHRGTPLQQPSHRRACCTEPFWAPKSQDCNARTYIRTCIHVKSRGFPLNSRSQSNGHSTEYRSKARQLQT